MPAPQTLAELLDSKALAVVGASSRPGSAGNRVVQHLTASGYAGEVVLISRREAEIDGRRTYPSLGAYPGQIDHALLLVPWPALETAIRDCVGKKVSVASIFAAGFAESGTAGERHQRKLRDLAAAGGMRLLGPNCLGVINAHNGMVATASSALESIALTPGPVSVVSQSGAVGMHMVALLGEADLGLRYYVSTGNEVDITAGEVLAHIATDEATDVILVYLEGVRDPQRFCAALTQLVKVGKTVVAVKVGRTARGTAAVASHTAALAGNDLVYDAVFRRHGVLRVDTPPDAVAVASLVMSGATRRRRPERVAVLTISGGMGALMAEELEFRGYELPVPSAFAQTAMRQLVPFCTPHNPIDVTGQITAEPEKLMPFLELAAADDRVDAITALLSYTVLVPRVYDTYRKALIAQAFQSDLLIATEGLFDDGQRRDLAKNGIVAARDTRRLAHLLDLLRSLHDARAVQGGHEPTSPGLPADTTLPDLESMTRMAQAGVPVAAWLAVGDPEEASEAAAKLGGPVAVKLLVPDVLHKAEAGLVEIGVEAAGAAVAAARLLARRLPGAQLIVQAMVPQGYAEVILGARRDETFGLVYLIGRGGLAAEAAADTAVLLPPVDRSDFVAALSGLRSPVHAPGGAPIDEEALWAVFRAIERLVAEDLTITDAEINPVLVGPQGGGAIAVDAVIRCRHGGHAAAGLPDDISGGTP